MIVLATASRLPHPDQESASLATVLCGAGMPAEVWAWDEPGLPWDAPKVVILRSTWNYIDHLDAFLAWTRRVEKSTALINDADTVAWNIHKKYLLDLRARGVPIVPTHVVTRGDPLPAVDGPVVIKPVISAGARGTKHFTHASSSEARAHLATLVQDGPALLQPFVPRVTSEGERSLVFFHDAFSHAVVKTPAAGDFRVQEHLGGQTLPYCPTDEERRVAGRVLEAVTSATGKHERLYARVDLLATNAGPVLIEVELIEPYFYVEECGDREEVFARWVEAVRTQIDLCPRNP